MVSLNIGELFPNVNVLFLTSLQICVSYCIVCAFVLEDNPRALARGLISICQYHAYLSQQNAFTLCAL